MLWRAGADCDVECFFMELWCHGVVDALGKVLLRENVKLWRSGLIFFQILGLFLDFWKSRGLRAIMSGANRFIAPHHFEEANRVA